jgi:hypothetical protein
LASHIRKKRKELYVYPRYSLVMAMDRVRSGCPRILGLWVASFVQIFAHEFADLDIRKTAGLEWILNFARECPMELHKFESDKAHIRNPNEFTIIDE